MTMRILITGGAGFIGSHLTRWLVVRLLRMSRDRKYKRHILMRQQFLCTDFSVVSLNCLDEQAAIWSNKRSIINTCRSRKRCSVRISTVDVSVATRTIDQLPQCSQVQNGQPSMCGMIAVTTFTPS